MEKSTNLQKIVKAIVDFCKECSKNGVTCNPEEGEYCNDLVDYIKYIMEIQIYEKADRNKIV